MVLAQRVGQKRSFLAGLLLTIVTFGIYAVYWNYKAHNELYRQFELGRENRDEGMVWYVLGLVLPPFLLAYMWVFASNVAYLRERIGLAKRMTPGRFLALAGAGAGAVAAGLIVVEVALLSLGDNPPQGEVDAAVSRVLPAVLALLAVAVVLLGLGFRGLQRDINELWDAYDARMSYLRLHPEEIVYRPAYMADLAPTATPTGIADSVRREVDALRARHPDLRALPELDAHLAQAQAGDVEARERAEVLLGDLVSVLMQRAEALREIEDSAARGEDASDARERLAMLESALFTR